MAKNKLPTTKKPIPVKIVSEGSKATIGGDDKKWRAEDGLCTLQRAEEIRKDKALLKDIKALAKEQVKALSKI
jgi:hypothetical protein